jgi:hypothetical protein
MKRKSPTLASKNSRARATEPDTVDEAVDAGSGDERIVARPDGYHWLAPDGKQEFGPFETIEDARADMEATDEDREADAGEALHAAESEIGIADWIDPETGEPAEGQSPPHLDEE